MLHSVQVARAHRIYRNLVKQWVVSIECSDRYAPQVRAAQQWCYDNGIALAYFNENHLVFKTEGDALLYYMAHK